MTKRLMCLALFAAMAAGVGAQVEDGGAKEDEGAQLESGGAQVESVTNAPQVEPADTAALGEAVVCGARCVQRADGMWIYPAQELLDAATDGYSLLAKISLPRIRVDEAMGTVTALSNLGTVQLRINDVVATRDEMLALDARAVQRIEFIDNPGVRYGEGVAYVINIRVRRAASGYTLGANLLNAFTALHGGETVYGRFNRGRSELSASASLDYERFHGAEYDERATYTLESGDAVTLHRRSLDQLSRSLGQNAALTYSLSDTSYVFQARLTASGTLRPDKTDALMETDGTSYRDRSTSRNFTPSLDFYFHRDLRRHQSFTANAVGTFIRTRGTTEMGEGAPYAYTTDGRTRSLWTEALYENRLRPFTVTGGVQYALRYSRNRYAGDASALNGLHTASLYVFGQLQGRVGRFTYTGGLGASHRRYSQGGALQHFWLIRPKVTLAWALTDRLRLKYDAEVSQHVSQIALVSDVSIKRNAMETLVGNPALRPNRVESHLLGLSYTSPRLTAQVQAYYRRNPHCNMAQYIRRDGSFIYTQTNEGRVNMFYVDAYTQYEVIPRRLTATVYGGVYRFFNYGADYRHFYTSFNGGCSLQAYLGRWSLGAYADNGWRFMEGENRGHQAGAWYLTATYRATDALSVSLFAQHPFSQHPLTYSAEVVSRYVHKDITQHHRDLGNLVCLRLSWRLDRGRRYRDIDRALEHKDTDAGILGKETAK